MCIKIVIHILTLIYTIHFMSMIFLLVFRFVWVSEWVLFLLLLFYLIGTGVNA